MADQQQTGPQGPVDPQGTPVRPSYYVHNPWRAWISAGFAGGSMILTVTTVFYALGRLPLALVIASMVLAALSLGFGLYARQRAARFDAQVLGGGIPPTAG